nr:hypothetical protein [Gaetbulibacter sp. 4G1]
MKLIFSAEGALVKLIAPKQKKEINKKTELKNSERIITEQNDKKIIHLIIKQTSPL